MCFIFHFILPLNLTNYVFSTNDARLYSSGIMIKFREINDLLISYWMLRVCLKKKMYAETGFITLFHKRDC